MSNGVPLPGIEHVVVLQLENRSFDNVLGGLYPDLTKKEPVQTYYRGLLGTETNSIWPGGPSVMVFQGLPDDPSTYTMPYPDPGELYTDMVEQIFGSQNATPAPGTATMSGFASNYWYQKPSRDGVLANPKHIMQYYSAQTMPVSTYLATQYAVCDYWFASGPVQTIANRVFTHCGTPSKFPNSHTSRVDNPDFTKDWWHPLTPPVTDPTIFQLLDEQYGQSSPSAPLNWKVYYHDAPLSVLCDYVYYHWDYDSWTGGNVWSFEPDSLTNQPGFASDVQKGLLPTYTYIEPRYTDHSDDPLDYPNPNSNHPGGSGVDWWDPNEQYYPPPIDVRYGEIFLCNVYSILLNHPEVFAKTLLIVTYDEHGGLYDHVPPPPAISPFTGRIDNFKYDRYGVRVPTILINPSIKPGTIYPPRDPKAGIVNRPFDHTSILSTLIAQFGLQSGSLSPRVDQAPQLTGLVPATQKTYERPPLVCPQPPSAIWRLQTPRSQPRPRPRARTLAGALGPLYQRIAQSKRYRR
jgi:phospholipase C